MRHAWISRNQSRQHMAALSGQVASESLVWAALPNHIQHAQMEHRQHRWRSSMSCSVHCDRTHDPALLVQNSLAVNFVAFPHCCQVRPGHQRAHIAVAFFIENIARLQHSCLQLLSSPRLGICGIACKRGNVYCHVCPTFTDIGLELVLGVCMNISSFCHNRGSHAALPSGNSCAIDAIATV